MEKPRISSDFNQIHGKALDLLSTPCDLRRHFLFVIVVHHLRTRIFFRPAVCPPAFALGHPFYTVRILILNRGLVKLYANLFRTGKLGNRLAWPSQNSAGLRGRHFTLQGRRKNIAPSTGEGACKSLGADDHTRLGWYGRTLTIAPTVRVRLAHGD